MIREEDCLENMDLLIQVQLCIVKKSSDLSKFRIFADLPRIKFNISEQKVGLINQFIQSFGDTISERKYVEQKVSVLPRKQSDHRIDLEELIMEIDKEEEIKPDSLQTILEFECTLGLLSVLIRDSNNPIAIFEIKGLTAKGDIKSESAVMSASLGSLNVIDPLASPNHDNSMLISPILSSGEKLDLLTSEFCWKAGNEKCDFKFLTIKTRPIKFVFARECVLRIYTFAKNIATSKSNPTNNVNKATHVERKTRRKVSSWKFDVDLSSITILIAEEAGVIGSIIFEGFYFSAISDLAIVKASGTVGKLTWYDETRAKPRAILQIDENDAIDFQFETFEPGKEPIKGYDSNLDVNAASWRFLYDIKYMKRMTTYMTKLRDIKFILENAQKAAQDSSTKIQETAGKLNFKVLIKTPIIDIPNTSEDDSDRILLYLGEITASSAIKNPAMEETDLLNSRYGINVSSMKVQTLTTSVETKAMNIIEDVNLVIQYDSLIPLKDFPKSLVFVNVSEVSVKMTNHQYRLCVEIFRLFTAPTDAEIVLQDFPSTSPVNTSHSEYNINLSRLVLEVYSCPTKYDVREKYSLARFYGNSATAKLRSWTNHPLLFELRFSSLSVIDTRTSNKSVFRDIMVPLGESQDQFVLKLEMDGPKYDYHVSIDRPKLIMEIDHIFAIQAFAVAAWNTEAPTQESFLTGRVSFVEAELIIVGNPESKDSDAVILLTKHLAVIHGSVISTSFNELGMFFCVMNQRKETELRFLDDCNADYNWDGQFNEDGTKKSHSVLDTSNLLFRVSNQDILLLKKIFGRLISLNSTQEGSIEPKPYKVSQKFKLSMEGIQAVLIDDFSGLHLPLFELGLDHTVFEISDWSGKVNSILKVVRI
jgi:vacuolar protein sorting-associated protein 13A/C